MERIGQVVAVKFCGRSDLSSHASHGSRYVVSLPLATTHRIANE